MIRMERLLFIDDTYIELPENWDDVTFEQFVKLQVCDNVDLNAVSILTGVSKEDWANSNKTRLYSLIFTRTFNNSIYYVNYC
jgi:hypothetical protein